MTSWRRPPIEGIIPRRMPPRPRPRPRPPVLLVAVILMGCDHTEPFLPAPYGSPPPPAAAQVRLTYNLGQDQRSEEHTSELQSRLHLVCRLLLEKKKKKNKYKYIRK